MAEVDGTLTPQPDDLGKLSDAATKGEWFIFCEALMRGIMSDDRCVIGHVDQAVDDPWKHDADFIVALVNAYRSGRLVSAPAAPQAVNKCEIARSGRDRLEWVLSQLADREDDTRFVLVDVTPDDDCDVTLGQLRALFIDAPTASQAADKAAVLMRRVAVLEAALKPFAIAADVREPIDKDRSDEIACFSGLCSPLAGQLRAARAAFREG